jgi:hypothetical protein
MLPQTKIFEGRTKGRDGLFEALLKGLMCSRRQLTSTFGRISSGLGKRYPYFPISRALSFRKLANVSLDFPGIRESWNHGIRESWNPGILESWNPGILESWNPGIMESWNHGILESWNHGILESWNPGIMESWNHGILESWNP